MLIQDQRIDPTAPQGGAGDVLQKSLSQKKAELSRANLTRGELSASWKVMPSNTYTRMYFF